MAEFKRLRSLLPHVLPGRCLDHSKSPLVKEGCASCALACNVPPPWSDDLLLAIACLCENVSFWAASVRLLRNLEITVEELKFAPQDLVWMQVIRQWLTVQVDTAQELYSTAVSLAEKYREDPSFSQRLEAISCFFRCLKSYLKKAGFPHATCGCKVHKIPVNFFREISYSGAKQLDQIEIMRLWSNGTSHRHVCAECGQVEAAQKLHKVCHLCKREKGRLMVKAYYCGLSCAVKNWHLHKLLHNALSVSAVSRFGNKWDPRDFLTPTNP